MADAEVKIVGLSRFRSTMKKAGVDMADMKEANAAVSRTVQARASQIAPSRSGRLAGSIRPSRQVARAVVRSNLIYAPVIHWGWPHRHMVAQPFLTEAAAQTSSQWLKEYELALQAIVDKVEGA